MFTTPARLFRALAIAEAITWTLLIAALVIRAVTGERAFVSVAGGIHGFVFLAYGATAILVAVNQRWSIPVGALAVVSAVIPYATVPVDVWLHRSGRLVGEWRLDATDDPRDQRWLDRLVRWFLRRPLVLALLILAAVVLLFVVLLAAGPPGGK